MDDFILREDIFPFFCRYPECGDFFEKEEFVDAIMSNGVVYADCGNTIYQGIVCQYCGKTILVQMNRANPVIDLRNFIISSNPNKEGNDIEQVIERRRPREGSDPLEFKFFPAWDEDCISFEEIEKAFAKPLYAVYRAAGIPYLLDEQEVSDRLQQENLAKGTKLRRLYPDISFFRNVLTVLAPGRTTRLIPNNAGNLVPSADEVSAGDILEKNQAWTCIAQEALGKPLRQHISDFLDERGFKGIKEEAIDKAIAENIWKFRYEPTYKIEELISKYGLNKKIYDYLKSTFLEFTNPICAELALAGNRQELSKWVEQAEKGSALFVDAPMGLGKTFAIVQALVDNPDYSAVIFMPTVRMCREIIDSLKTKLAVKQGLDYWEIEHAYEEIQSKEGVPERHIKREFLKDEVYFVDGINEEECPYYDKIIKRFNQKWLFKKDYCLNCEKYKDCRFIAHHEVAFTSRILVATHKQYDRIFRDKRFHGWKKSFHIPSEDKIERNAFIVDEDIILEKCYHPIGIKRNRLKAFVAKLDEFFVGWNNEEEMTNPVHKLFSRIHQCDVTSYIPAADPNYKLPGKVHKQWEDEFKEIGLFPPEYIKEEEGLGNYLKCYEEGIRLGVVVRAFGRKNKEKETDGNPIIYFPNPEKYDLSKAPPHVFFDGTKLDDKFIKNKLANIEIKNINISIKPLFNLEVFQNVNSDLTKTKVEEDRPLVETLVKDLLLSLGSWNKYFIITKKIIREKYIDDFLSEAPPDYFIVTENFGNLRGINTAKECNVGIMLGSHLLSDAVEIAMALEVVQDSLPKLHIRSTEGEFWKWDRANFVRKYNEKYKLVEELMEAVRFSEHRQAIARTRPLLHEVAFYVLSKDPVQQYEPNAAIKEEPFRTDLFQPKATRSDSKYELVKAAALSWLETNEYLKTGDIKGKVGMTRQTLSKHLGAMIENGILERNKPGGHKYRLARK